MLIKTIGTAMLVYGLSANVFAGDFGAGNGGDTVTCKTNPTYKGTYFLDYLAAKMDSPSANYYNSTDEVIELLREKIPTLANRLETLRNSFKSASKKGQYVWKDMVPKEHADEDLSFQIPEGCEAAPTQLILRRSFNKDRVYLFAEKKKVETLSEQKSWAFLHEALWDIYDSAFEIRIVNEFIHNKENSKLSSKEFIAEINNAVSFKNFIDIDSYKLLVEAEDALLRYDMPDVLHGEAIDPSNMSHEQREDIVKLASRYANILDDIYVMNYSDMGYRVDRVYHLSVSIVLDNRYRSL